MTKFNKTLFIIGTLITIIFVRTVYADRQCNQYSQKTYDALLMRAQNNHDNDAMFTLSTMYCDDCSSDLNSCVNDAMKWLKAAADNGNKRAQSYLQQKHNMSEFAENKKGLIFFLNDEIKNGDYIFRSYTDSEAYTAYFEIVQNNKVIFAPSKNKDAVEYRGKLYSKGLFGDAIPTLGVWLNTGGNADEEEVRYFCLGKELKCLTTKNLDSPYWSIHRFSEDYSHEAVNAFKGGEAQLTACTAPDNLVTTTPKNNSDENFAQGCNNHAVQMQRKIFRDLYSAHNYANAFDSLNTFIVRCRSSITDSQQLMWLQNDLLIALINLKEKPQCAALSNEIKNNPDFSKTTDTFKAKLQFNIDKCKTLP